MARLLFFGRFSDYMSNQDIALPDSITDTEALLNWLAAKHPNFAEHARRPDTSIVLNHTIIRAPQTITDADEIAFLSPVSGG